MPPPLYEAASSLNAFQAFENRLIRTRHLIGRSDAETEVERTTRLSEVLFGDVSVNEAESARKIRGSTKRTEFGMALRANTAFQRLLQRKASPEDRDELLRNKGFLAVGFGVREFYLTHAEWIFNGCKSETYNIEDLRRTEDMFIRDEVSTEESLKVGGILLRPVIGFKTKSVTTRTQVGLYEITTPMYEWANDLTEVLRSSRQEKGESLTSSDLLAHFGENPEWVNDDTFLVEQCRRDTSGTNGTASVILVSKDRVLANKMANAANVTVFRHDPESVIRELQISELSHNTKILCSDLWAITSRLSHTKADPVQCYIDTGSVASAAARYKAEKRTKTLPGIIFRKEVLDSGFNESGNRYSRYSLKEVKREGVLRPEIHSPVFKRKRSRVPRPLDRTYTPSTSWRAGSPIGDYK